MRKKRRIAFRDKVPAWDPTRLTPELFRQASSIDGAILIDPRGTCRTPLASSSTVPHGPSARLHDGSRYNSAIRYIRSSTTANGSP